MAVQKAKILVTVYAQEPTPKALEEALLARSLESIVFQLDDGDWIGEHALQSVETVPPEKVKDELIAIGNDGSFFEEQP